MYTDNELDTFGDFGRSLKSTVKKAFKAPVKVTKGLTKAVTKPITKINKIAMKPISRLPGMKPVVRLSDKLTARTTSLVTKAMTKPVSFASKSANTVRDLGSKVLKTTAMVNYGIASKLPGGSKIMTKTPGLNLLANQAVKLNTPKSSGDAQSYNEDYYQEAESAIAEKPLSGRKVKIYIDGYEAEVPEEYLSRSGTFVDDEGNVWSTQQPMASTSVEQPFIEPQESAMEMPEPIEPMSASWNEDAYYPEEQYAQQAEAPGVEMESFEPMTEQGEQVENPIVAETMTPTTIVPTAAPTQMNESWLIKFLKAAFKEG